MIVFAIGFPNDGLGWYQSYFPSLRHSDVTWGLGIARGGVRPLAPPTDCHPRIGLFAWAYLEAYERWGILLTFPLGYPDPVLPTFFIIWGSEHIHVYTVCVVVVPSELKQYKYAMLISKCTLVS